MDKIRTNIALSPETKQRLAEIGGGQRKLGEAIEIMLEHYDSMQQHPAPVLDLRGRVHALEMRVEGLQDRLNGLCPTDLP